MVLNPGDFKIGTWVVEIASLVKCSLCRHTDLSSIPKTHVKKARYGMELHTCNPGTGEAGKPSLVSQPSLA